MTLPYPLYEGKVGSPSTTITAPFTAGTDTTITVADASVLPAAPNRVTIMTADRLTFATVTYSSIVANVLSGVVYEEGTTQVYPANSIALRNITHADDWDTKRDIQYLDTAKLDKNQGAANVGKVMTVGADGTLYPATGGGGGGTTDYNALTNKPQIAGITLSGNKTLADLGIASASALAGKLTLREGTIEIGDDANGTYIWT